MTAINNVFCFLVISVLFLTIGVQALKTVLSKEKTKKGQEGRTQQ